MSFLYEGPSVELFPQLAKPCGKAFGELALGLGALALGLGALICGLGTKTLSVVPGLRRQTSNAPNRASNW
jgi:hypothetical protein